MAFLYFLQLCRVGRATWQPAASLQACSYGRPWHGYDSRGSALHLWFHSGTSFSYKTHQALWNGYGAAIPGGNVAVPHLCVVYKYTGNTLGLLIVLLVISCTVNLDTHESEVWDRGQQAEERPSVARERRGEHSCNIMRAWAAPLTLSLNMHAILTLYNLHSFFCTLSAVNRKRPCCTEHWKDRSHTHGW